MTLRVVDALVLRRHLRPMPLSVRVPSAGPPPGPSAVVATRRGAIDRQSRVEGFNAAVVAYQVSRKLADRDSARPWIAPVASNEIGRLLIEPSLCLDPRPEVVGPLSGQRPDIGPAIGRH